LAKNLEFKLFLGTWCGDTQRELGGMFKLLDALGVTEDQMEMYAISEARTVLLAMKKNTTYLTFRHLSFLKIVKKTTEL
jgi:hypothetical protein